MSTTRMTALKEWAVAVAALAQGETIVLLRKGGIREQGGRFSVEQSQVWLYPTYEHQQPHLLKPNYRDRVQPVPSGWHLEAVEIAAYADITDIFQVSDAAAIEALLPFHIWNEQFAAERFNWKPRQPLYVLLLRVHRLKTAQSIAYRSEYSGCKSWIDLQESSLTAGLMAEAVPALPDEIYEQQVNAVRQILEQIEPQAIGS